MKINKNKIKIIISTILTIWMQLEAIRQNGYWGFGGNALMPILCWLAFWALPELLGELIKEFKKL